MNTSPTSSLCKPSGADPIPLGTLGYFRARNRHRLHSLVIKEFQNSGLSQADLARRLGKGADLVCRWLGAPGNWTLDTVSDFLFAISGGEPDYRVVYPLDKPARNDVAPDWLDDPDTPIIRLHDGGQTFERRPQPSGLPGSDQNTTAA